MIDHIGLNVNDLERSKTFIVAALAPLGYELVVEFAGWAGFGVRGKPDFWITQSETVAPTHIALTASDRAAVDAFYQAALAAGGEDNGAPGVRAHYHEHYYGAFVLDPDGHNLEAVCHTPA